ncbi:MAG: DUF167 domain-containing protein [Acidobacteria bacterium]|nr:DUF167 domain-containing protein [Acidobacteriota bacterium]
MTIELRVQPRARRNALLPGPEGTWKLYLTAPAVEGRANQALIEFFARGLRIARSRVRLLSGKTSRHKVVALDGITEEQFRRILSPQKGG